ncbi:MAG: META domain-containing protein [Pedobacter sp.]|nr:MAG: META domain-containing protein [Pedobacter sp.]
MKNIMLVMLSIIMAVGLNSCSRDLSSHVKSKSEWVLVEWPNREMPDKGQATLHIEDQKISGKSFCNVFFGQAVFNGNALKFSGFGSTMMFCEAFDKAEKAYIADLEAVNSGSLQAGKLVLRKNDQIVMVFKRKPSEK